MELLLDTISLHSTFYFIYVPDTYSIHLVNMLYLLRYLVTYT